MLCMVITMAPAMAWAETGEGGPETPEAVTLYIEDGNITINETNYTQGTEETTSWSDTSNKALTITSRNPAEASANTVTVDNSGETPINITLDNLNMRHLASLLLDDAEHDSALLCDRGIEFASGEHLLVLGVVHNERNVSALVEFQLLKPNHTVVETALSVDCRNIYLLGFYPIGDKVNQPLFLEQEIGHYAGRNKHGNDY